MKQTRKTFSPKPSKHPASKSLNPGQDVPAVLSLLVFFVACCFLSCSQRGYCPGENESLTTLNGNWKATDSWSIVGVTFPCPSYHYTCRLNTTQTEIRIHNFQNTGSENYFSAHIDSTTGCVIIPDQILLFNNDIWGKLSKAKWRWITVDRVMIYYTFKNWDINLFGILELTKQ